MPKQHGQSLRQWERWVLFRRLYWRLFGVQPGVCVWCPPGDPRIRIGKRVRIADGVQIIPYNHDPEDPRENLPAEPVEIGDDCWIGANAIILPGVSLGPYTVVGAGAVVTRSFPHGHVVLVGNPARPAERKEREERGRWL